MAAPAEGLEPPTTGLRTPRLFPLSYAGTRPNAPSILPDIPGHALGSALAAVLRVCYTPAG